MNFQIDLDDVYQMFGFKKKNHASKYLRKHFIKDVDFTETYQPNWSGTGHRVAFMMSESCAEKIQDRNK